MKTLYNPKLKSLCRNLRNNSTLSEVLLWNQLKARKIKGYQFSRQKPIDDYIVDFYCPMLVFAVELDGGQHAEEQIRGYDEARNEYLIAHGVNVMRFGRVFT